MQSIRLGRYGCILFGLLISYVGLSTAQSQSARNRILAEVNASSTTRLRGSANPHAKSASDIGNTDPSKKISGITIHFAPTTTQKAELDALVLAQAAPGSPYYHKWLTSAEFAVRFGLSESDIAAVENWLERQGFAIERVSNSRTSIVFSGSVAQISAAFQADIRNYKVRGLQHFAVANDLSIPSALAGIVQSVRNLDDFRPRPHVRFRTPQRSISPKFTSSQSGDHYLTPKDVATIYDINAAYNSSYTGTGQSIAVAGQSEIVASDIEAFQTAAGLTTKDPTMVLVPSSGSAAIATGDEAESDLDVEYSGGIAKGASIYFVYVGNNSNYSVWDSIQYAVDTDIAPIISVSYGACETELSSSDFATLEAMMEQGASQGQSIIVSSGDDGSTGCNGTSGLTTTQQEALAVEYPASSAYVTGLGGTEFPSANVAASNTTYWESASGSDLIGSALSYIPEEVWNDDSSSYGLASGGGGASVFTARPSWQTGVTGIPSGSYRLVPDVSLSSSADNAGYLYCSSDSTATGISGSCSNGFRDSSDVYLTVAGGTSFAAPIFAGMLAIINQKENSSGEGLINSTLYTLAAHTSDYASAFHDISSGTNACTAGSSYCSTASESAYAATTGYDEATGLGSVDLYNLLTLWPSSGSASSLLATTTTLTAATTAPSSGASDVINITVAPESSSETGVPTGTLRIAVDGTTVTSSLALSSGSATYTFSSTTTGSHVISAAYSGDSTFAASSGTVTVTVGSSSTTGSGGSGTTTVTVTPSGGYTGTIDFALGTSSTYITDYACYNLADPTISGTSAVSETLTISAGTANCSSSAVRKGHARAFRRTAAEHSNYTNRGLPPALEAGVGLIGFLWIMIFSRCSRKISALLAIAGIALLGMTLSGCGGSSTSATKSFTVSVSPSTVTVSAGSSGIPTGSYSLTLEGQDSSSSSLTSSTTITLVVD